MNNLFTLPLFIVNFSYSIFISIQKEGGGQKYRFEGSTGWTPLTWQKLLMTVLSVVNFLSYTLQIRNKQVRSNQFILIPHYSCGTVISMPPPPSVIFRTHIKIKNDLKPYIIALIFSIHEIIDRVYIILFTYMQFLIIIIIKPLFLIITIWYIP